MKALGLRAAFAKRSESEVSRLGGLPCRLLSDEQAKVNRKPVYPDPAAALAADFSPPRSAQYAFEARREAEHSKLSSSHNQVLGRDEYG